jgi:hypothetical protein
VEPWARTAEPGSDTAASTISMVLLMFIFSL